MWATRIVELTKRVPRFNDYLIKSFRSDNISNIPNVLEDLFKQTIWVIDNHMGPDKPKLIYHGYRELTPVERVAKFRRETVYTKNFSIRPSMCRSLEFLFEFMNERYVMSVDVPYVHNHEIIIQGTSYFPLFAIVDKGGLYRNKDMVILQVMRAKLRFWRDKIVKFTTIEGVSYSAFSITAKLHQASRGRQKNPPLILHHLAKYGLTKSLEIYGLQKTISLVKEIQTDPEYQHIYVQEGIYIRINKSNFDQRAKRFVVSLLTIYKFWKRFSYEELFDPRYYIFATGKWAYPSATKAQMIYNHALEYMQMNQTIIDPVAQRQHASVGIEYDDLDGLMLWMFNNIDQLVLEYMQNSTNLYTKKIGQTHQMLSAMIRTFNTKLFTEVINTKVGIRHETIKRLMYPQSYTHWVKNSPMFRSAPMMYNDNWLLTVGGSKFRTTANAELSLDRTGGTMSLSLLKAHPSSMVVESILTYPTGKPIIAGTINPFLQVESDGSIIRPEWANEIDNVFDR